MTAAIVIISIAVFCALILNLAAKPKVTRGVAGVFTFLSAVGGLTLYGIGFGAVTENPFLAIVRTLFAVCRMYAGVNELGSISSASLFETPGTLSLFWVLHFMAFYATASATISTVGAAALKKLKYWLQRYGKSVIVYGITAETVEMGRTLMAGGQREIIYIGSKCDPALESAINAMGGLFRSDDHALDPDTDFLKSIGSHKGAPELVLYAMEPDDSKNLIYARKFLKALKENQVDTEKVHLIIRSSDDDPDFPLARTEDRYGYGDVKTTTDVALTARMLMQEMPPCRKMHFDTQGRAKEDFDAVIVGFGRTGNEMTRQLVRNAQFTGSTFHAAIFTPNVDKENGFFCLNYPGLVENYDIRFYGDDARSRAFYEYLQNHAATLRYVIIATGNEERDREMWHNINYFLNSRHCDAAVCRCSATAIAWSEAPGGEVKYRSVYSSDRICSDRCDRMAMELNYSYVNDSNVTPAGAWAVCDHFSRESSRAAADYIRAFGEMTGMSEEEILNGGWSNLTDAQRENLGRTEHLRWCAFHYSMGFTAMPLATVENRGAIYKEQLAKSGKASIRINKDLKTRQHACLCSWEELDELARVEEKYKGTLTSYKDMDIRNVLSLPAVLRAEKESGS